MNLIKQKIMKKNNNKNDKKPTITKLNNQLDINNEKNNNKTLFKSKEKEKNEL